MSASPCTGSTPTAKGSVGAPFVTPVMVSTGSATFARLTTETDGGWLALLATTARFRSLSTATAEGEAPTGIEGDTKLVDKFMSEMEFAFGPDWPLFTTTATPVAVFTATETG